MANDWNTQFYANVWNELMKAAEEVKAQMSAISDTVEVRTDGMMVCPGCGMPTQVDTHRLLVSTDTFADELGHFELELARYATTRCCGTPLRAEVPEGDNE